MLHQLPLLRGMMDTATPPPVRVSHPIDYDRLQAAAKDLSARMAAARADDEAEEEAIIEMLLL
jgi:hypothetical protein